ncbi:hypothetical protein [Spirosoma migulaei]
MTPKTTLPVMAFNPLSEFFLASQWIHKLSRLWASRSLNDHIVPYSAMKRGLGSVSWIRLVTVFWIGLFFSCAVLEIDLGDMGDEFGDVYDTYVHTTPVQSPTPTVIDYRLILPAALASTPYKHPLVWAVDPLLVLTLPIFAFFLHRRLKRRRRQVLHAVWQL